VEAVGATQMRDLTVAYHKTGDLKMQDLTDVAGPNRRGEKYKAYR